MSLFIKLLDNTSLRVFFEPSDLVEDIKLKIQSQTGAQSDTIRLLFGAKPLDDKKMISEYGIQRGSTLDLCYRLCGGSMGMKFVDITQTSGATQKQWNSSAPEWRTAVPGLCLEGKCKNEACRAYDKWVIISKEMGTYDLIEDDYTNKCPICSQYVEVENCGFNRCNYSFSGAIIQGGGKPLKKVKKEGIEVGNYYLKFDHIQIGKVTWASLIIQTQNLLV